MTISRNDKVGKGHVAADVSGRVWNTHAASQSISNRLNTQAATSVVLPSPPRGCVCGFDTAGGVAVGIGGGSCSADTCTTSFRVRGSCLDPTGVTFCVCAGSWRLRYTGVGGSKYDPVAGWLMRSFNATYGFLGWRVSINGAASVNISFSTGVFASEALASAACINQSYPFVLGAPSSVRLWFFDTPLLQNYTENVDTSGGCEFVLEPGP